MRQQPATVWVFIGRCQLAPGAPAQGAASDVRYSGTLQCVSDPSVSSMRVEDAIPARLLPNATYIAPQFPLCMAVMGNDGRVIVKCLNETVLDGICPETAQSSGSFSFVGDGRVIEGLEVARDG